MRKESSLWISSSSSSPLSTSSTSTVSWVDLESLRESSGGFLGSHNIEDDIYYSYGHIFGTRIKVILISKNIQYSEKEKLELKKVTGKIHEMYVEDQLNPLNAPCNYSEEFQRKILDYLK